MKAVATGDALEALLSKMRGFLRTLLVDLANQLNWALRRAQLLGKAFFFFSIRKSYFRTVTASFFTVHFSKLIYEHVVDLLRRSSTPSSLHVQFSLLNILVFHLFVNRNS